MQRTPGAYLPALMSSPTMVTVADLLSEGQIISPDIPIAAWDITADASQWARRTAAVTIPPGVIPAGASMGLELRIRTGPRPDLLVCVGTLGVQDITQPHPVGPVALTLSDRCQRITDDRFPVARSVGGGTVIGAITALLTESVPWAAVGVAPGVIDHDAPAATYSQDRVGAVKHLAAAIGCAVYCEPFGDFLIAPIPDPAADPVWAVGPGQGLMTGSTTVSRVGVYNCVSAYSTGSIPVSGTLLADGATPAAADLDPYSPTYVYGPFGRVVRYLPSPFFITTGQCDAAGLAYLMKTKALRRSVQFTCIPNGALEPDDAVSVDFGSGPEHHLVDRLRIASGQPMTVSSRSGLASNDQAGS
jgi:hypothetical protein